MLDSLPIKDTTKHIMGLGDSRPIIHKSILKLGPFSVAANNLLKMSECWKKNLTPGEGQSGTPSAVA